jgi:hypothetical protein
VVSVTVRYGRILGLLNRVFTINEVINCIVDQSDLTVDSKTWTVFARSNTGVVCSNPTRGIDICATLFCVYVVLCVGGGLETDLFPVQ